MADQFGVYASRFRRLGSGQPTVIDGSAVLLYPGIPRYVDGDKATDGDGRSWANAHNTIQLGVTAAQDGDTVWVKPKLMAGTVTDPVNYAETVIIPAGKRIALIGVGGGPAQGAQPQIKKGSGSTALLTMRSAGCYVGNISFNGGGSTGGGVLLDDDGGSSKNAFGSVIESCFFKNCKGSTATSAKTGGAIQWPAAGNAWQVLIRGNRFYKNVGDVVLLGTSGSRPQDVVIERNTFSGPAASVDCQVYVAGGSGMNGVIVQHNLFTCFPALGSGAVLRCVDMTGCVGSLHDNGFSVASAKTFGAAGDGGLVPTTVFLTKNYDEGGLIART